MISLRAQEGLQFTAILLPQPSARITRVHPPHTTPYILESNRPLIVMRAGENRGTETSFCWKWVNEQTASFHRTMMERKGHCWRLVPRLPGPTHSQPCSAQKSIVQQTPVVVTDEDFLREKKSLFFLSCFLLCFSFFKKKIALFWLLMYPTIELKLHLKIIIVMAPVGCSHSHGGCSGGKLSCHGGYCPRDSLKRLKHEVGGRSGSDGTGSKTSPHTRCATISCRTSVKPLRLQG